MPAIIDLMNRATDKDWGWWPFLGLRPRKDVPMTTGHVAKMSLFFGPLYSLPFSLLLLRHAQSGNLGEWVVTMAGTAVFCTAAFFVLYRLTFAPCWNHRAENLRPPSFGSP